MLKQITGRMLVATLVTAGAVMAVSAPAGAQTAYEDEITAVCNTTTGLYEITVTLTNNVDESAELGFHYETFDAGGSSGFATISFVPAVLPALGTSSVSFTAPGDTVYVELEIGAEYAQFVYDIDRTHDLDGDCVPVPTTTTTAAIPTTTTTTAATAATVTTPRFTG